MEKKQDAREGGQGAFLDTFDKDEMMTIYRSVRVNVMMAREQLSVPGFKKADRLAYDSLRHAVKHGESALLKIDRMFKGLGYKFAGPDYGW